MVERITTAGELKRKCELSGGRFDGFSVALKGLPSLVPFPTDLRSELDVLENFLVLELGSEPSSNLLHNWNELYLVTFEYAEVNNKSNLSTTQKCLAVIH